MTSNAGEGGRISAMASLVLKMSVSLDGYIAPVDGSTDWVAAGRSDDGASRVLGLARVRGLGRDDDRHRRPGRSHHTAQARALGRIPARPRRGTIRPIAG
jgi:hypothetical protein